MQLLRPRLRTAFTVAASLAWAACGTSAKPEAPSKIEPKVEQPASDELFRIDRLVRIDLTVDQADWDALRKQHHPAEEVFGEDCLAGPAARPYDYVPARLSLDGAAPIDVELRKKGFLGSASTTRPSLKLRFAEPLYGQTRLTLNNNQQDASQVHQCVAYRAFERAGVRAPRCNLAVVTVNGAELGVYSNVESIKRPFLERAFGDGSGNLYEGQMADFRPDWINTLARKTNRKGADASALTAVVDALARPDAEVVAAVEHVVDLDAFLTFWIMERLVGHWDSYTNNQNNFYLYENPGNGKLYFIPWGADSVLGDPDVLSRYRAPESVYATSALPHRLYELPAIRERYVKRLRELLEVWDEQQMLAEIETLEKLARPHLHVHESAFDGGLGKVRRFVKQRRATIEAAIAGGPQAWEAPLRSWPCSVTGGTLTAEFETTWGKLQSMNPFGSGTLKLDVEVGGAKLKLGRTGVTAGPSDQFGSRPTVALFAMRDDGKIMVAFLSFDPELFVAGAKPQVDAYGVFGLLVEATFGGDFTLAGFLGRGSIELTEAGTSDGAAIAGTVSLAIAHPKYWLDDLAAGPAAQQ